MRHSASFTRRHFLHSLVGAAATGMVCGIASRASGATDSYSGMFLINLQLTGGIDVTHFIDPKVNVAGKPIITNWSTTQGVQQAGNIPFAPFAANATFFNKYYQNILVINGVDAQTNSHTVGVLHNWSGRNTEGYPSLTALFAAVKQTTLPMPYLNFGGFSSTQDITTLTQVGNLNVLQNLLEPTISTSANKMFVQNSDWQRIRAMHTANITARSQSAATVEGARVLQQSYVDALARSDAISDFDTVLPPINQLQQSRRVGNITSTLHQQLQVALLAFKAGVSVSADVFESGFDTHDNSDTRLSPILANVTDALDYLWTTAASLGIDNRLVVVVGSDFVRTPYYNAGDGKDHWPIGSVMVMQQNAKYTNRVVGLTDASQNAVKINAQTLKADPNGVTLTPEHVHKALRKQLGLDTAAVTQKFPFLTTADVAIFG